MSKHEAWRHVIGARTCMPVGRWKSSAGSLVRLWRGQPGSQRKTSSQDGRICYTVKWVTVDSLDSTYACVSWAALAAGMISLYTPARVEAHKRLQEQSREAVYRSSLQVLCVCGERRQRRGSGVVEGWWMALSKHARRQP